MPTRDYGLAARRRVEALHDFHVLQCRFALCGVWFTAGSVSLTGDVSSTDINVGGSESAAASVGKTRASGTDGEPAAKKVCKHGTNHEVVV